MRPRDGKHAIRGPLPHGLRSARLAVGAGSERGSGMRDIGIVGGGISGLHLGIRLLDLGHSATIYHPQTGDEIAQGRILNSVVHQHDTVQREQAMGIDFWNESNCRVGRGHDHCLNIPGLEPIRFWGAFNGFGKVSTTASCSPG